MAEALQIERGAPARHKVVSHELLQGNNRLLPIEFAKWSPVCAAHRLN
jgi:hypothetical protein